jgi:hypothetical protein
LERNRNGITCCAAIACSDQNQKTPHLGFRELPT